jgi:hypothetical protein
MNSLCIPRAMPYTTVADVTRVFNELFEGIFVERVDERNATDSHGQEFKMFYIHFGPGTSIEMEIFKEKMEEDGVVQVMTGRGKWFWKVYLNKSSKAVEKPVRKGARIMTEEDEQLFLQWKETRNRAAEDSIHGFTQEEVNVLDEATETNELTEAEMDELEEEHSACSTHAEEDELMHIANEMANK